MRLTDKRILVTGAAGFIGSTLTENLLKKGCSVIGYDNFNPYYSGKERNLIHCMNNENFSLVKEDILKYDRLKDSMKNIDLVFHLAAQPGIRYSFENPVSTNKINSEGTLNVLKSCKECNVERLIYASSSSVYGNQQYSPADEHHPLNPISIYGVTKLSAERFCLLYSKLCNQYVVSLRYHTVYGPRGRPDMAVFTWIDLLFKNKSITVFGDGNQTRDMTYVDDIVDGTILAAETDDLDGEIINLASGRNVSMKYVLDLLFQLTGTTDSKIEYENFRNYEAKDTHANITKANRILGYIPKISIEEGLRQTVEWYKQTLLKKTV